MPKRRKRKSSNNRTFLKRKTLKPKTDNQADYIRTMVDADVTLCSGPAGTGKTAVAVGLACEYILEKKVDKIIITRPVVESGRGLGFLPGTFTEKIHPYLVPVLEEMNLYLLPDKVNSLRSMNLIEVCPLEYMRGRNFHNAFMILDEAQNCTHEQIKMFLTRIGRNSKAIINGDTEQSDLPLSMRGGLANCIDRLEDVEGVGICELTSADIVRNDVIARILSKLSND
jgi:phosphate starvation-inducible PhoH-like protein